MTDKRLVLSTAGSQEEARRIAQALVEKQLAACVNIVPEIYSMYRWKGNVEHAEEFLLLIKTTASAFPLLLVALQELHSYDVPECISVVLDNGSPAYLEWLGESIAK